MNHSRHYQLLPFAFCIVMITGLLIHSCRRIQREELPEVKVNTVKEKFFDVPATVDPIIKALADKIRRQNDQYNFVDELVKRVGFPKWDKSLIVTNEGSRTAVARVMDDSTALVYIPFAIDSLGLVKATLLIQVSPSDSIFRLINDWEYRNFGFDSTGNYAWRALNLFHVFATFQRTIYNDSIFQIMDGRIMDGDSSWHPKIKLRPVNSPNGRFSYLQPVQYCYATYIEIPCTGGGNSKLSVGSACYQFNGYVCTTIMVDIDEDGNIPPPPGGNTGGGGGGTGPTWPYPCGGGNNNPPARLSVAEPCPGPTGWYPLPEQPNELGYYNSRIAYLSIYLDSLNFGMIECDSLNLMPLDPVTGFGKMYQDIAQHTPHDSVIGRIDSLRGVFPNYPVDNYYLQSLQEAYGAVVNCDFFPVRIQQLPIGHTPASLLEYFRVHINDFISSSLGINFSPYEMSDPSIPLFWTDPRFNSIDTSSTGALVHIEIPGNDGSVVLSGYNHSFLSSGYQSHSFTVTTMQTPLDNEHPVAGNRRWGVYNDPYGGFTFYTMAVDRIWDWWTQAGSDAIGALTGNDGFDRADELWTDVQQNMINFINTNGGSATYYSRKTIIARPKWNDVKDYLMGLISFEVLKQRLGC
jgi:hypothetical protein